MIEVNGIRHYKDLSLVTCSGCDMEISGFRLCDVCADKEYKKMKRAGWSEEAILRYIDKYYVIHNFNWKRYRQHRKMV